MCMAATKATFWGLPRALRTSYSSRPTSCLAISKALSIRQRLPATRTRVRTSQAGGPHKIGLPLLQLRAGTPAQQVVALVRVGQHQALPVVPPFALAARTRTEPLPVPFSQIRIHVPHHVRVPTDREPCVGRHRQQVGLVLVLQPGQQFPRVAVDRVAHDSGQRHAGGLRPGQQLLG